jgi:hypothetical protein
MGIKVVEMRFSKILSKKVARKTQHVENEEAYVGGEVNIAWGLLDGVLQERLCVVMLRDATIGLVRAVTKLCVRGSEDLLGRVRRMGIHEIVVVIIILIEDSVFE